MVMRSVNMIENNIDTSKIIKDAWGNTLIADEVDYSIDYFRNGGSSIGVARMLAKIYKGTGVQINLKEFYKSPFLETIETIVKERTQNGKDTNKDVKGLVNQISWIAENYAEKTAVRFEDNEYSYKYIDERSDWLAGTIARMGIKEGSIISIYLSKRSVYTIISIIGVLKARCAYVPIEHRFPKERIQLILEQSNASLVIVDTETSIGEVELDNTLNIEGLQESTVKGPTDQEDIESLAYVMFTSGTTGMPKGVMISNFSLSCFIEEMKRITKSTENDNWLAVTSICFDISTVEIFLPLVTGGTIHLVGEDYLLSPYMFFEDISRFNITWMQATPSIYSVLCEYEINYGIKGLVGGEKLDIDLCKKIVDHGIDAINMYGPTETTVWSSSFRISQHLDSKEVSIGKPLNGEAFYVLDTDNSIVEDGTIGELYISGVGLSKGYINDMEKTASSFIRHDFGESKSVTLYKTGDLVYRDFKSENYFYVSRIDDQIKLNGFRIELGEIKTAINSEFDVGAIEILVKKDDGATLLCAFLVLKNKGILPSHIKSRLSDKLPWYMIPQRIILVERMPFNTSGKVNRKVLLDMV